MIEKLFSFIWRKRLAEDNFKVVKIKNWRTALVESYGKRQVVSFCFWWFQ
jgi:hypothetical protein